VRTVAAIVGAVERDIKVRAFAVHREAEIGRQNPGDAIGDVIEGKSLADGVAPARIAFAPELVAQPGYAIGARRLTRGAEAGAEPRGHAERLEETVGHHAGKHHFHRRAAGIGEAPGSLEKGADGGRGARVAFDIDHVAPGNAGLQLHQPLRLGIRQRPQQQRVEQGVHGGGSRHAQAEGEDAGEHRSGPA
jgi:hypothetical protein